MLRIMAALTAFALCAGASAYQTPVGECAPFTYDGWEPVGPGEAGGLQAIRPHPTDPDIVIAGSDALGIQLSRDGGRTWQVCNRGIIAVPPYFNTNAAYPLAWHPENRDVCYATHAGGVYISEDGGESWFQHEQHTPARWPPALEMDIDPADADTAYVILVNGQLFVTRDGCRTWEELEAVPTEGFGRWRSGSYLAIDPSAPPERRTLYAACTGGVARSADGGRSWTVLPNGDLGAECRNVRVVPGFEDGRDAVVASFRSVPYSAEEIAEDRSLRRQAKFEGGVHVSFDGGQSWEPRNAGLPVDRARNFELLTVDPTDPQTLYVATTRADTWPVGAFKSTDGGRSWTRITRAYGPDRNVEFGWIRPHVQDFEAHGGTWSPHLMVFEVSRADPNVLFMRGSGDCGIMRSDDAGAHWRQSYCDPVPGREGYWTGRGANLAYALSLGFDPADPAKLYYGASDFGSLVSDDGGRSFRLFLSVNWYGWGEGTPLRFPGGEWYSVGMDVRTYITKFDMAKREYFTTEEAGVGFKDDVFCTVVDPDDSDTVYCCPGTWSRPPTGAILKSTDGAHRWTILGPHASGLPDTRFCAFPRLVIDPRGTTQTRRLIAAAGRFGVFRTDDAGATWCRVSRGIPEGEVITDLAMCRDRPDVLWAASGSNRLMGFDYTGANLEDGLFGHVFRSEDAGERWQQVLDGPADVRWLEADPADPEVAWIAVYHHADREALLPGGVYRTTDSGRSWQRVFDQPTPTALAVRPDRPETVFAAITEVATDEHAHGRLGEAQEVLPGIYRSTDGGASWEDVTGGLRDAVTRYLIMAINPGDPEVLYVGATGGLWRKRME